MIQKLEFVQIRGDVCPKTETAYLMVRTERGSYSSLNMDESLLFEVASYLNRVQVLVLPDSSGWGPTSLGVSHFGATDIAMLVRYLHDLALKLLSHKKKQDIELLSPSPEPWPESAE